MKESIDCDLHFNVCTFPLLLCASEYEPPAKYLTIQIRICPCTLAALMQHIFMCYTKVRANAVTHFSKMEILYTKAKQNGMSGERKEYEDKIHSLSLYVYCAIHRHLQSLSK